MTDDRLRMAAVAPAPGGEPLLTVAKPATGPRQKSWRNQWSVSRRLPGTSPRVNYLGGVGSFEPHVHAIGIGKISRRSREPPARHTLSLANAIFQDSLFNSGRAEAAPLQWLDPKRARTRALPNLVRSRLSLGPSTSQMEAPDHELPRPCQPHGAAQIRRGITFPKWQRPRRAEIFALPENKILDDKAERASLFRLQE